MNYYLISYFVLCAIGYVFTEVCAVRQGWPATWEWPSKLNNWLLSFKKQPYVKPEYTVTVTYPYRGVVVTKFETSTEMHAFSEGYIMAEDALTFK